MHRNRIGRLFNTLTAICFFLNITLGHNDSYLRIRIESVRKRGLVLQTLGYCQLVDSAVIESIVVS